MHDKTDKVNCPNCGKGGTWTPSNAFRPFCSDRCKLIDLGGWASEEHKIPGPIINPDNLDNPDSSGNEQESNS